MFVLPFGTPRGDRLNRYYFLNTIAQPLETAIALAAQIFGGVPLDMGLYRVDELIQAVPALNNAGRHAVLGPDAARLMGTAAETHSAV